MNARPSRSFATLSLLGAVLWSGCGGGSSASGSWTKIATFAPLGGVPTAYFGVQFVSSSVGYVCGGNAFVGKSTDGGKTWRKLDLSSVPGLNTTSPYLNLNALYFFDANEGWVTGNGYLLHTLDGGVTWTQAMPTAPDRYLPSPQSIHFGDHLHGAVVGSNGRALYTADGGATWQRPVMDVNYESLGSNFTSVQFVDANTGFVSGTLQVVLKTTDGGRTWVTMHNASTSATADVFTGTASHRLSFTDSRTGYLALDTGIAKTTDGGATWTLLPGSPSTTTIAFVSKDVGFTVDQPVGSAPSFSATSDGGATWTRQKTTAVGLNSMNFLDARTGWALFEDRDLYAYTAN